jgi:hypothetical protein
MIKTTLALQMIPSSDGVSPHNGGKLHLNTAGRATHNQSMATTNGKLSKLQTVASGFPINSGAHTDLKGNSTPNKSQSFNNQGFKYHSRENMNMSRANLDRNDP